MGFNDWISIFKGGTQRDSEGREHDGDALIDKAVAKFDALLHEPPAVIGHPEDNAPAYSWVSALKKEGSVLYAKFRDVVPEFADLVKRGLFKKRSAAFYNDGTLRHVAFLGAVPPAVKGLSDIGFNQGKGRLGEESWSFEFSETGGSTFTEQDAAELGRYIARLVGPRRGPSFREANASLDEQTQAGLRIAARVNPKKK